MKHFSGKELEPSKFYQMGDFIVEFIKDTGELIESYPGKFSGVYLCKLTNFTNSSKHNLGELEREMKLVKNQNYPCFQEISKEDIQKYIDSKERGIKLEQERICFLKKFL